MSSLRRVKQFLVWLLAAVLICSAQLAVAAEVCRTASFQGLEEVTQRVKRILGPDTTNASEIKLFINRTSSGELYIQSNFKSRDTDTGNLSEYPTKLRTNGIGNLKDALKNVIFWSELPPNADAVVAMAMQTVQIYVHPAMLDSAGRPSIDLSGSKNIRLATDRGIVPTGQIDLLTLSGPPPALVERITGCCFRGRPPGKARQIQETLGQQRIDPSSTRVRTQ